MIKFSHSIFALPFALMAAFLAAGAARSAGQHDAPWPSGLQLGLLIVCMVAARSVAMTFNRLVDASLDAANPRTAERSLPAGRISRKHAAGFLIVTATVFVAGCAGFGVAGDNWIPLWLALPVLGYLCFYSYTKRFTRYSHFVLGSAIALSPVAAWLAVHPGSLGWPAFVLMGAVATWIAGFDIIYACQDVAFDRARGLFSLPARVGVGRSLWIARGSHAVTIALLIALGRITPLGTLYAIGVGIVAGLLIVENAIVRADDLSRVNLAFFTVNGVISLLLGTLTVVDCLLM